MKIQSLTPSDVRGWPQNRNPNCDGGHCLRPDGEVRRMPISDNPDHGAVILCYACWKREMQFRRERNQDLEAGNHFKLPAWESLPVYGGAS